MRTLKWGVIFLLGVLVGSCLATPPALQYASASEVMQPIPPRAVAPYGDVQDAEVKVRFEEGHCSGVLISRLPAATQSSNYVVTDYHCFDNEDGTFAKVQSVDGIAMTGEVIANDNNDHVIVRLSKPVPGKPVWFGPFPVPGTEIFTWGNPGSLEHQLRIGHVTGVWQSPEKKDDPSRLYYVVDLNTWHGDSGGPVFDMQGRLIGVNYGYYFENNGTNGTGFRIALVLPFKFSEAQLRGIP